MRERRRSRSVQPVYRDMRKEPVPPALVGTGEEPPDEEELNLPDPNLSALNDIGATLRDIETMMGEQNKTLVEIFTLNRLQVGAAGASYLEAQTTRKGVENLVTQTCAARIADTIEAMEARKREKRREKHERTRDARRNPHTSATIMGVVSVLTKIEYEEKWRGQEFTEEEKLRWRPEMSRAVKRGPGQKKRSHRRTKTRRTATAAPAQRRRHQRWMCQQRATWPRLRTEHGDWQTD